MSCTSTLGFPCMVGLHIGHYSFVLFSILQLYQQKTNMSPLLYHYIPMCLPQCKIHESPNYNLLQGNHNTFRLNHIHKFHSNHHCCWIIGVIWSVFCIDHLIYLLKNLKKQVKKIQKGMFKNSYISLPFLIHYSIYIGLLQGQKLN